MPSCAFLTIDSTEGWFVDDELIESPLRELGWSLQHVPWTAELDWNCFDVVVIRSTWDYQDHVIQFMDVLDSIERSDAMLMNSLDVVKWNIDKAYLLELGRLGVEIVPTIDFDQLSASTVELAFERFGVDELIVKPRIGANADDTFRVSAHRSWETIINTFENRKGFLQPFLSSIVSEGEFSAIFFDEQLSHIILKTAANGDFRVQEEHGGRVFAVQDPEALLLRTAKSVVDKLPFRTLYARVDLVRMPNGKFAIMEVELIEPALYFRYCDRAPMNFACAIQRTIQTS